MVSSVENGVYVTSVQGLHAGLNPISGSFNLQSSGFMIENGKVTTYGPADSADITVSGKDLSLNWSSVAGAQEYTVELAKDANFKNILESKLTPDVFIKLIIYTSAYYLPISRAFEIISF